MAIVTVSFDINDDNFDVETWAAVLEWLPFDDPENPPAIGTRAEKLAYFTDALKKHANREITKTKKTRAYRSARATADAVPDVDLGDGA